MSLLSRPALALKQMPKATLNRFHYKFISFFPLFSKILYWSLKINIFQLYDWLLSCTVSIYTKLNRWHSWHIGWTGSTSSRAWQHRSCLRSAALVSCCSTARTRRTCRVSRANCSSSRPPQPSELPSSVRVGLCASNCPVTCSDSLQQAVHPSACSLSIVRVLVLCCCCRCSVFLLCLISPRLLFRNAWIESKNFINRNDIVVFELTANFRNRQK